MGGNYGHNKEKSTVYHVLIHSRYHLVELGLDQSGPMVPNQPRWEHQCIFAVVC